MAEHSFAYMTLLTSVGGREYRLVGQLCANELAVQAGNVADRDALRTFGFASASVRTVTEAQFIHLSQHSLGATSRFYLTLRQQSQLAYLGRNEQHGRTVLTSCGTSATTDTCCRIHSLVCNGLGNRNCVCIRDTACVYGNITTGLHNLVVSATVYHQVADNREAGRTPRFNSDGVTIVETADINLTSSSTCCRSVRMTIDVQ